MINSTERSDILVFNCYLCHVRFLLTCYVCSTKIGEISDISKCFENFVSQALGVLTRIYAAELRFKINIGKTPPRKEQQWFTNINNGNVKWISISDLGSNEIFIEDSKEYLTKEAISKFNIIVVPEDTILVSFKLTVGRVGISNCELTTNEAVARFYLPKSYFREYTYLSLKKI